MKHNKKVNPLTHFNNLKASAIKKAGKEISTYKKSLKKAQDGIATPIIPVPEYTSDRDVHSGPLEQLDAERLESGFPSKGLYSFYPYNMQLRKNNERHMREHDFFNEGKYEQKKGGPIKRKKK